MHYLTAMCIQQFQNITKFGNEPSFRTFYHAPTICKHINQTIPQQGSKPLSTHWSWKHLTTSSAQKQHGFPTNLPQAFSNYRH